MENLLFQMKFTSKQFGKNYTKCKKEETIQKKKVKNAIQKGNIDGAKIYAENSIRKKSEAMNHLKLQSRMDAVVSRIDMAIKMKMVSKQMQTVTKGMGKVLYSMNPVKISMVMDSFEKNFEQLDVSTNFMENAMDQNMALLTPEKEVNDLMTQIADENNLNLNFELNNGNIPNNKIDQNIKQDNTDELMKRLDTLKLPN